MNRQFSAPTVVNLEITDICNEKCRHCYNFWRQENVLSTSLTKERMDQLVDMFVDARVFHVVLSGGEPFARFDILEYGFKRLIDNNITISCNSNLTMATEEKIKRLRDIGLDHILTSLNSYDPELSDHIVNHKGAFEKIVSGIKLAVKNGIRVSANMIVSQLNKNHVHKTGKLAAELGCQKIFGTRVVPSVNEKNPAESIFKLTKEDALHTLEQLVKVKEETGIMIGTLVSYPLCFLSDLEKFRDFVGRGCPAQSGHIMSINANGETHACVHQEEGYGNVFELGIFKTYQNMREWHSEKYLHKGCEGCEYINICRSGCRMSAHSYFAKHDEKDNLMVSKTNFVKPYRIVYDESIYGRLNRELRFTVPQRLRFRKENGFYLVNIRW
ncbi:MAG: radical SAM protein [Proteobacteria bacterium]|nr:radical SAM protein [Pseudomonadota bacterium]